MSSNPGGSPAVLSAELGVPMSKMELLEQRIYGGRSDSQAEPTYTAVTQDSGDVDSMDTEHSQGDSSLSQPTRKRKRNFTADEDQRIEEGYRRFGSQWDQVAQWAAIDRTALQIKSRHSRLMKLQRSTDTPSPSLPARKKVKPSPKVSADASESSIAARGLASPKKQATLTMMGLSPQKQSIRSSSPSVPVRGNAVGDGGSNVPTDSALAERETQLAKRELEVSAREKVVKRLIEEQKQYVPTPAPASVPAGTPVATEKDERRKTVLVELLIQQADTEREENRREVAKSTMRLGGMVTERRGATFMEVWKDGEEHARMELKIKGLEKEKQSLEKLRKQLSKKRAALTKQRGDDGVDVDAIEAEIERLALQEEMLKLNVTAMKKEESEYQAALEKLAAERVLHVRLVKRLRDQSISRFSDHPLLENKYLLLNILGKGGFSEVYKAFDFEENCSVACKIHQLNNQWGEVRKKNYIKHALREYNIFKAINHPSVVGLRGVFEIDENGFCTVLEYCNDGDLDIKLKTQGRLSEREARCIITQVFNGLVHLNRLEKPVIHYDLKPGNILFHEGQVKLTDFGLAKIMEEDTQDGMIELTSQGAGTYWYLPPECLQVSAMPPKISSKVDVWSAGVILYQMLFGKKPFGHNVSQKQILQDRIITADVQVDFPANPKVSEEAKDFMKQCLEPSQHKRPDVLSISKHPYLAAYKPRPLAK